jgi:hypothetical protein
MNDSAYLGKKGVCLGKKGVWNLFAAWGWGTVYQLEGGA